jgi:hypothetical protein
MSSSGIWARFSSTTRRSVRYVGCVAVQWHRCFLRLLEPERAFSTHIAKSVCGCGRRADRYRSGAPTADQPTATARHVLLCAGCGVMGASPQQGMERRAICPSRLQRCGWRRHSHWLPLCCAGMGRRSPYALVVASGRAAYSRQTNRAGRGWSAHSSPGQSPSRMYPSPG